MGDFMFQTENSARYDQYLQDDKFIIVNKQTGTKQRVRISPDSKKQKTESTIIYLIGLENHMFDFEQELIQQTESIKYINLPIDKEFLTK